MGLTEKDVIKIAFLARLGIDEKDVKSYTHDLSDMLGLMVELDAVDTRNIEPMAHPMDQIQRLRADKVTEQNNRHNFQAIAPLVEDGLYLVPRVIE
jgi:aspartyl-tRNA(Asn)/glutamyl-tRNA(Gln) amidotransferase subunit C